MDGLQKFLEAFPQCQAWPQLFDSKPEKQSVGYSRYRISGYHTYFVIGKDGTIVDSRKDDLSRDSIGALLEALFAAGVRLTSDEIATLYQSL